MGMLDVFRNVMRSKGGEQQRLKDAMAPEETVDSGEPTDTNQDAPVRPRHVDTGRRIHTLGIPTQDRPIEEMQQGWRFIYYDHWYELGVRHGRPVIIRLKQNSIDGELGGVALDLPRGAIVQHPL